MKKVDKRIKPLENNGGRTSSSMLERLKIVNEIKPLLNPALQLEVASLPLASRLHLQDVAEFLEEVLQAVD